MAFHVLAEIFEGMHHERIIKEVRTKGRPINRLMKEWTDILKREGRGERDHFPEGEEPKDFIALRKRLDKEGDAAYRAMFREYGEKEMAELFFNDYDEYERRKGAGKAMLYAEPDIAEAQKQLDEIDKRILAEKSEEERRELEEAKAGAGTVTGLLTSTEHAPPLYPREPWRALLEAEKPKVDQKQTGGPSTGVDTGEDTVNGR